MNLFITGTGTDVGKTLVAAILAEALQADYWKPIQAGNESTTDSDWVKEMVSNNKTIVHPESYLLKTPASPHFAAAKEGIEISLKKIVDNVPITKNHLIIEGAGGLLVPLNKKEFVLDLIKQLDANVIIVSKNYLGSINHSLLTAKVLKQNNIKVLGWIFNDDYINYESEIVGWSGFPKIASIGKLPIINKKIVLSQAKQIQEQLKMFL